MRAILTIEMDNAAFVDGNGNGAELAQILRDLAARIDGAELATADSYALRDTNGNRVGAAVIEA